MRQTLSWSLLAVGGGVAWGLAFGREGMLVVPWVALVPLLLLLGQRRPGLLGWAFGLAFWITSMPWIARVLAAYGELPGWLAGLCLLLLAAYLALFPALFAALGRRLWQRPGILLPLAALPALWVALEWLRAHLFSGFPWNQAAYAWVDMPGALPTSAWISAYGVSYLLVFANTGVALALVRRRWEAAALGLLIPLLLLALGGRWGVGRAVPATPLPPVSVRILQPNIENELAPELATVAANYAKVFRLSREACDPGALLVWPESATWPYVWAAHPRLQQDLAELTRRGCSVILNSVEPAEDAYYNSVYLVDARGEQGRQDKRHLVPFGEYVPLAGVFSFLDKVARNAGAFRAGDSVELLSWGGERFGVAVCFEVIFPAEVAELVREGASVLVTVTNDAWYGDSSAPWQHLRAARFRAAESRRPMLRAAITGVSAIIAADGSLLASLGLYREGVLRARVEGRTDLSPASRLPWLPPLVCSLLAAFAIVIDRRFEG